MCGLSGNLWKKSKKRTTRKMLVQHSYTTLLLLIASHAYAVSPPKQIQRTGQPLELNRGARIAAARRPSQTCHAENEYQCPGSSDSCNCHNIHTLCDGIQDCDSGIDETPEFCRSQCSNLHGWWCESSSRCIHRLKMCDKSRACGKDSDRKANCRATACPSELGYHRCGKSGQCVRISDLCDDVTSPCVNNWQPSSSSNLCGSGPAPTPEGPGGVYTDCRNSRDLTKTYRGSAVPVRTVGDINGGVSICEATLYSHNKVRLNHVTTRHLVYDDALAETAEEWSIYLANTGTFEHSSPEFRNGAGENLYYGASSGIEVQYSLADAAYSWYIEIEDYDFHTGEGRGVIGHFTQMVWADTTSVGCGVASIMRDSYLYTYVTCHYSPPGNYIGQYTSQVHNLKPNPPIPNHPMDLELENGGCIEKAENCDAWSAYCREYSLVRDACIRQCLCY